MKYIRTLGGRIIGFKPYNKDLDLVVHLSQFANYQGDNTPVKQADTIEELCDEFVMITNKPQVVYSDIKYNDLAISRIRDKNISVEIYGAIWTDKGLIYVAKMNDKGVLCLI